MIIKKLSLIAVVSLTFSCINAIAQEAPKAAFDATFVAGGPAGSSTVRMVSDGKGHMRTETKTNGQTFVTIMDYPGKVAYTVLDAQKMVMKTPLTATTEVHDSESAKKAKAKSLGAKTVNGHPCHGWEYTIPGGKSEVWTGDDINYLVKSETTTKQGKMTMDLKTWAAPKLGANDFKVPTGYKVMGTNGAK